MFEAADSSGGLHLLDTGERATYPCRAGGFAVAGNRSAILYSFQIGASFIIPQTAVRLDTDQVKYFSAGTFISRLE